MDRGRGGPASFRGNLKWARFALLFNPDMRTGKGIFALRAALACMVLSAAGGARGQDNRIEWLNNYRDAIQEAKRTQKPIFLEFRCEP